ncbi:PAS domain-containing protein [Qipengyuania sp. XHP0207]|uniref:PAS domain-containing protein n=1 Tax=Qipengyuania sp. XHP0207 TaxID=3038078 RepID=UPI00241F5395|nr:PAS domain-containing protein [Qipengyuania sp. XHP0207]MDG5748942.1 PAS domain-containing protein [Qipengyuania sp. XHP0207]
MDTFFTSAELPSGLRSAFAESRISLSLADANAQDMPLIAVNRPFCEMSGYGPDEVLDRNCRFLQPDESPEAVRKDMRGFLYDSDKLDARFVIPNVTKDGRKFLNLVYMAKLTKGDEVAFVLGSQFPVDPEKASEPDLYDRALKESLKQLNLLTGDDNWALLGSFDALASSHSIIARARME